MSPSPNAWNVEIARVRVAVGHELVDADGHLLGRLVGEGEGQDLGRSRSARRDQPGDPPGDDLRLARPGTRYDKERSVSWVTARSWSGLSPPSNASRPEGAGRARVESMTGTSSRHAGSWSRGCASRRARTRVRVTGEPAGWVVVVGAMSGASPAAVTPSLSDPKTARPKPFDPSTASSRSASGPTLANPSALPRRRRRATSVPGDTSKWASPAIRGAILSRRQALSSASDGAGPDSRPLEALHTSWPNAPEAASQPDPDSAGRFSARPRARRPPSSRQRRSRHARRP